MKNTLPVSLYTHPQLCESVRMEPWKQRGRVGSDTHISKGLFTQRAFEVTVKAKADQFQNLEQILFVYKSLQIKVPGAKQVDVKQLMACYLIISYLYNKLSI